MKKLALLAALALMGSSAWAQVVSIVQLNNFGPPDSPIYYLTQGTAGGSNVKVQLLGGPVGGTLAPIKSTSTGNPDTFSIIPGADGYFDGGIGIIPGVTGTGPADLELRAFVGDSWTAATHTASAKWTQPVTNWDSTPPNPPPASIQALNITGNLTVIPVPEPSTIALGLLGAAALLIRRRK